MIERILNKIEQDFLQLDFKELSNNENYPEILYNILLFLSCLSDAEYIDYIDEQLYEFILKEIYLNKSRFKLSFYNGMTGIVFLLEHSKLSSEYSDLLSQYFNKTISDTMLVLLPFFKDSKKEYEFFGGLLGIVYYYFQRKTPINHKELYILEKSLNKLLGVIKKEINVESFDISLIHGMVSFLKIFRSYLEKEESKEIKEIYNKMMDCYLKLVIDKEKFEEIFGKKMGWCNSRLSILLLLYSLPVEQEISSYLYNELLEIFDSSGSWEYDDSYLCHGYAGMSIMMCAFNYTGKNRIFVREKLREELQNKKNLLGNLNQSPNIIENCLGVILALINDYSNKVDILNKIMLTL